MLKELSNTVKTKEKGGIIMNKNPKMKNRPELDKNDTGGTDHNELFVYKRYKKV